MRPSLGGLGSRLSRRRGGGGGAAAGEGAAGTGGGKRQQRRRRRQGRRRAAPGREMALDEAHKIVLKSYSTERTFAMVEGEAKVCFVVARTASKADIAEAVFALYGMRPVSVNTSRTIYGKKAFVKFASAEKAKDLATNMGML